ncbi:hypothetical protein EDEG_03540 [Edhazardia aedis USNM 41457]|uniref:Uncharacterized protein n=1 Tax=Edhazardia aedis (strain USNM 41457) TaxID=1003232 RepID=J9DHD5_EDHAE|nr:hypothetical protein EDEG_03540 [Edhazardia aedis USNM 41457]|eukprot:EJW02015.1 hypothetical protein EDEG_03540 [Edhazardia aedis USNM 41457]
MLKEITEFSTDEIPRYVKLTLMSMDVINTAFSINANIAYEGLYQFMLPLFVVLYTGPLCGNFVTQFFKPTQDNLIAYFVGAMVFTFLKNYPKFRRLTIVAHIFMKILLVSAFKNDTKPIFLNIFWFLICSFVGSITYKLVVGIKNVIKMGEKEFKEIFGIVICVLLAKYFELSDLFISLMVILMCISVGIELKDCCCYRMTKSLKKPITSNDKQDEEVENYNKENSESFIDKEEEEEKKDESNNYEEIETEDIIEEIHPAPKKRGRPRKTSIISQPASVTSTKRKTAAKKSLKD